MMVVDDSSDESAVMCCSFSLLNFNYTAPFTISEP